MDLQKRPWFQQGLQEGFENDMQNLSKIDLEGSQKGVRFAIGQFFKSCCFAKDILQIPKPVLAREREARLHV